MKLRASHDPYRATRIIPAPQIAREQPLAAASLRVVAWVDRYVPFQLAGGELALHNMLRHLVDCGHRVDVATHWPSRNTSTAPHEVDGVRVWPNDAAARLVEAADVIMGHLLWTRQVVAAAARRPVPLVYVFHNTFTIEHWHLRAADVTAAVYNALWVREHITRTHPSWEGVPSTIVRPPVLSTDYALPDSEGSRDHVTLVNPNPDKGGLVFYGLAEREHHRRFLAVAGAYGQQLMPRQPQHRNVTWQRQTARMRDDVYARSWAVLMPSHYESWGRVAVEAMAAGVPVIAHPTPGLREALGDAPLWADRGDLRAWQAALRQLDDPACYAARRLAGLARAAELEQQSRGDLAAFDRLIRAAALAQQPLPSRGMVRHHHDPFASARRRGQVGPHTVPVDQPTEPALAGAAPATDPAHLQGSLAQRGGVPGGGPRADLRPDERGQQPGTGTDAIRTDDRMDRAADAAVAAAADAAQAAAADAEAAAAADELTAARQEEREQPRLVDQVPDRAQDVVEWVSEDGISDGERYDRAEAAEWVEEHRAGDNRRTVLRAVGPVLYTDWAG